MMRHEKVPARRPGQPLAECDTRLPALRLRTRQTGAPHNAKRHTAGAQSPCGTLFYCTAETCSSDRNATKRTSWHNTPMRQEKIFIHRPWIGSANNVSRCRETQETSPATETGETGTSRNAPRPHPPCRAPCGMAVAARHDPAGRARQRPERMQNPSSPPAPHDRSHVPCAKPHPRHAIPAATTCPAREFMLHRLAVTESPV